MTTKLVNDSDDRVLKPFWISPNKYHMTNDTANIAAFAYDYPPFDYDMLGTHAKNNKVALRAGRGAPARAKEENSKRVLSIHGINIMKFSGSFTIYAYATTKSGQKYHLGIQAIFSAGNSTSCTNCFVHSLIERRFSLKDVHVDEEDELKFRVKFKIHDGSTIQFKFSLQLGHSIVKTILGVTLQFSY